MADKKKGKRHGHCCGKGKCQCTGDQKRQRKRDGSCNTDSKDSKMDDKTDDNKDNGG
jgi:hypothetical protein